MSNQNSNQDQQEFNYRSMDPMSSKGSICSSDFDQFGLRYPTDHLDMVWPEIVTWPLELIAKYVDRVVFEIITNNNPEELGIIASSIKAKSAGNHTTTSLGNLAFIAMYAKDSKLKKVAYNALSKIKIEIISALMMMSMEPVVISSQPIAQA